ncbi:MAG TPA: flagellar assembly protein FliH [Aromatoleum sp.]|uniref:flagellar assembly protein FliH n=1 Tax=Aromatoleum sp. TaxID=2307007 RepID=UPI002B482265|nr:flagellar assembly protein FliH [Aromatoleum sp.]HJV26673.1 flagellar assembly protein FliH [Aromatoleum sp.]
MTMRHQAVGAYRRWEPPAFDDDGSTAPAAAEETEDHPPDPVAEAAPQPEFAPDMPLEPAIQLPTAADIEAMFEDARRDGFAAGLEEGAAQARQQADRISSLADTLAASFKEIDQEVADEVVALAIEVARHMVRQTLAEHPEAITDVVRNALHQLPQNQVRIHLNPEDLGLVKEFLADQPGHPHHLLIEDDTVTRGGCRISAPTSEIDATIETRWRRILEGLSRPETGWTPPK